MSQDQPSKPGEQGVVDVLKHAQLVTEQQVQSALQTQKKSGEPLRDILFKELTWDRLKQFLNYEIPSAFAGERKVVAEVLKDAGWITEQQFGDALHEVQLTGQSLGHVLLEKKIITAEQLQTALAHEKQTGLPLWRTLINLGYVDPQRISEVAGIAPPAPSENETPPAAPAAAASAGTSPTPRSPAEMIPSREAITGMTGVELVDAIVNSAVDARATDIHFDPEDEQARVRFRIDGMLYDILQLPNSIVPEVLSRLKVLGGMDITERRRAQEGHILHHKGDQEIDLRLASAPTVLGEKLAIRILNKQTLLTGIAQLGMELSQIDILESLLAQPYGLILATGPVGAGKTTTLYALLNETYIITKNVMTIEDPVEYRLRGVNQMQVDTPAGFGFLEGLRAILRQDPNIIMVGEIRDEETAMTATKASMTGILVLSTLHTNDAPSAISSLIGMRVPPFLIASGLTGVVGERLVRRICPRCKEQYQPSEKLLTDLGVPAEHHAKPFYHGTGCDHCFQTGYFGRTGVFEILSLNDDLKEAIFRGSSQAELRRIAIAAGMQPLAQSALHKVLDGVTSIEEYGRVIFT